MLTLDIHDLTVSQRGELGVVLESMGFKFYSVNSLYDPHNSLYYDSDNTLTGTDEITGQSISKEGLPLEIFSKANTGARS